MKKDSDMKTVEKMLTRPENIAEVFGKMYRKRLSPRQKELTPRPTE